MDEVAKESAKVDGLLVWHLSQQFLTVGFSLCKEVLCADFSRHLQRQSLFHCHTANSIYLHHRCSDLHFRPLLLWWIRSWFESILAQFPHPHLRPHTIRVLFLTWNNRCISSLTLYIRKLTMLEYIFGSAQTHRLSLAKRFNCLFSAPGVFKLWSYCLDVLLVDMGSVHGGAARGARILTRSSEVPTCETVQIRWH